MKTIYTIWILTSISLLISCKSDKTFSSKQQSNTAAFAVANFFDHVNVGAYEQSLLSFVQNPVDAGEINMDSYIEFVDDNLSNNKTISGLQITEETIEGVENSMRVTIVLTYNDGSEKSKWVICQKLDEEWKLTTRGSMF